MDEQNALFCVLRGLFFKFKKKKIFYFLARQHNYCNFCSFGFKQNELWRGWLPEVFYLCNFWIVEGEEYWSIWC